jgi:hypothetical protein
LRVRWRLGDGSHLTLIANLSSWPTDDLDWRAEGEILHCEPAGWPVAGQMQHVPPWAVCFALEAAT